MQAVGAVILHLKYETRERLILLAFLNVPRLTGFETRPALVPLTRSRTRAGTMMRRVARGTVQREKHRQPRHGFRLLARHATRLAGRIGRSVQLLAPTGSGLVVYDEAPASPITKGFLERLIPRDW
jgi:hypothetical protein